MAKVGMHRTTCQRTTRRTCNVCDVTYILCIYISPSGERAAGVSARFVRSQSRTINSSPALTGACRTVLIPLSSFALVVVPSNFEQRCSLSLQGQQMPGGRSSGWPRAWLPSRSQILVQPRLPCLFLNLTPTSTTSASRITSPSFATGAFSTL